MQKTLIRTSEDFVAGPFMRCTRCRRHAINWPVNNEAWSCPCGMDESGLELVSPYELIGTFWKLRKRTRVRVIDYNGGNSFRTVDVPGGVTRSVSILQLTEE